MILCDIGNSSYHFYERELTFKEDVELFDPSTIKEKVYYVCVQQDIKEELKLLDNWIDISVYIDFKKYYETMGIDRIMACEAIDNGIIIDAGSAITVDRMERGLFQGGFIYPGVVAMEETYKNISQALAYSFNYKVDLDKMPKNSQDAVSYGYLKLLHTEVISYKSDIYLTGGDGAKLLALFPDATLDEMLLFKGMQKIIQRADIC
ncbi:MAG: type III pantothenate kinase [Sulfurimonadaceae bacterium]|jgi:type III pantothenate kinase|nr:type III pantothenate kinase [Sulfurimonadaceae bacterium]